MAEIKKQAKAEFKGLEDKKNVSAVAFWKGLALIVSDEMTAAGNIVQVFEPAGDDFSRKPGATIRLDAPGGVPEEMDLEGIAVDGDLVHVLGSHSGRRKRVKEDSSYKKNREALTEAPDRQPSREALLRFRIAPAGAVERTSLAGFLRTREPFRTYASGASKENGIDAEGLAAKDGKLYVGFRGPVLRGNFTPVIRCRFDAAEASAEILFLELGGLGVRDLAAIESGFLVLAGPVGDGPGSYVLYRWDGSDGVPGVGAPGTRAIRLADLPMPDSADPLSPPKAEGLAVIEETAEHVDLLVVFDGLVDGHGVRYRLEK